MTARYNSSDNTLKEISQMEEPKRPFAGNYSPQESPEFRSDLYHYECNLEIYNDHINSLRTLSCHDSCRGLWKEGDMLEEGEDYKVGPFNVGEFKPKVLAFPLVPLKSEDDPYEELLTMIARSSWDRNEIIAEAKKQFIVTKR